MPKLSPDCFVLGLFGEFNFKVIYIGEKSLKKLPGQKLMIEIVKQSDAYKQAMSKGSMPEYPLNSLDN